MQRNSNHATTVLWRCLEACCHKEMWVAMLRAAGMDDEAMKRWHTEFEQRAPQGHHEFLLSLGIPKREVHRIRYWSRKAIASEGKEELITLRQ